MKTLWTLSVCLLLLLPGYGQSDWKLKKEVGNLKVYARTPKGGGVQEIKVKCMVDAPLSSVIAIITDVPATTDWVYACTEAHILKQLSETEAIVYGKLEFPFPLQNRDFVAKTSIWQDDRTKEVFINTYNLPNYIPKVRKHVRIPKLTIHWRLKPLNANQVAVDYIMASDPGGMIPNWLVNRVIDKGPIRSMEAFEKLLQLPKYQHVELSYIEDFDTENVLTGRE